MATVRFDTEHLQFVNRALAALEAERAACERWGIHSIELTLAIDDGTELRDRMTDANKDRDATAPLLSLIGRSKPW
jgi:hypothetical protein